MNRGLFFAIVISVGALVGGCSRKTVPVSTDTTTTQKQDSTTTRNNTLQIDSSYVERLIKKLMPGSSVGITLTPGQYDSLIKAIAQLPPGVRTIYKTDPAAQTKLALALDSLGNLQIRCQTLDRYYFEKDVESKKTIYVLTEELTKVKQENSRLEVQVRKEKVTAWEKIKIFFNTTGGFLTLVLVLMAIGTLAGIIKRK